MPRGQGRQRDGQARTGTMDGTQAGRRARPPPPPQLTHPCTHARMANQGIRPIIQPKPFSHPKPKTQRPTVAPTVPPPGYVWTNQTSAADNDWYVRGVSTVVCGGGEVDRAPLTSPALFPSAIIRYGVTYGVGKFVAVAASGTGNRVMTSPDGITVGPTPASPKSSKASPGHDSPIPPTPRTSGLPKSPPPTTIGNQ